MAEREVLEKHDVWVERDLRWQRKLRLLQSLWRQEHGWPSATVNTPWGPRRLGSRLPVEQATAKGWNFVPLGGRAFERARLEIETYGSLPRDHPNHKVIGRPRIFNDLLASQPLCFSLFTELDRDRNLATQTARSLWPHQVDEVTRIELEWSPGRGDPKYLGNRSAFDAYIEHTTPEGGLGLIGVEVKYHENLRQRAGELRERVRQVAERAELGVNLEDGRWHHAPLNQLLLDHLLALSIQQAEPKWSSVQFVLLYPAGNPRCQAAAEAYEKQIRRSETFRPLTLEEVVSAIRLHNDGDWIQDLFTRYLDMSRTVDAGLTLLNSST